MSSSLNTGGSSGSFIIFDDEGLFISLSVFEFDYCILTLLFGLPMFIIRPGPE